MSLSSTAMSMSTWRRTDAVPRGTPPPSAPPPSALVRRGTPPLGPLPSCASTARSEVRWQAPPDELPPTLAAGEGEADIIMIFVQN